MWGGEVVMVVVEVVDLERKSTNIND